MQKKQTTLIIVALLIVSGGLYAIFLYQKPHEQVAAPSEEFPAPMPLVKWCNLPFHFEIIENDPTILRTIPWLTYENKKEHYRFDYPYILILNTDVYSPSVAFYNPPFYIDISVSSITYPYQSSLDAFVKQFAPVGMRLEKRIKIDGYDAIVTYYVNDNKEGKDQSYTHVIKGNKFFTITTQCVDRERIWKSFRFE